MAEVSAVPTGDEVFGTGVRSAGDFFRLLGGIGLIGIARKVDAETAAPVHTPDTATAATATQEKPQPPGAFADIVANLTPVQWGGLIVAGGLAWALATGKFR